MTTTNLLGTLMILLVIATPFVIDFLTRNCPGRDGRWVFSRKEA